MSSPHEERKRKSFSEPPVPQPSKRPRQTFDSSKSPTPITSSSLSGQLETAPPSAAGTASTSSASLPLAAAPPAAPEASPALHTETANLRRQLQAAQSAIIYAKLKASKQKCRVSKSKNRELWRQVKEAEKEAAEARCRAVKAEERAAAAEQAAARVKNVSTASRRPTSAPPQTPHLTSPNHRQTSSPPPKTSEPPSSTDPSHSAPGPKSRRPASATQKQANKIKQLYQLHGGVQNFLTKLKGLVTRLGEQGRMQAPSWMEDVEEYFGLNKLYLTQLKILEQRETPNLSSELDDLERSLKGLKATAGNVKEALGPSAKSG